MLVLFVAVRPDVRSDRNEKDDVRVVEDLSEIFVEGRHGVSFAVLSLPGLTMSTPIPVANIVIPNWA